MEGSKALIGILCHNKKDNDRFISFCKELGYDPVDFKTSTSWEREFSLIICDHLTAPEYKRKLEEIKNSHLPIYIPIIICLPVEWDSSPYLDHGYDDIIRLPIRFSDLRGRIRSYVNLNLTSRKLKEHSDERYKILVEESIAGIYLFNDKSFLYINKAMANTFGYKPEEMIGKLHPRDIVHPEDYNLLENNIRKRLNGREKSIIYDLRGKHRSGRTIYGRVFGTRINMGEEAAILGTFLDLTAEKEARETLKYAEERYRALFNSAADAIFLMEGDAFKQCNPATLSMFQCKERDIIGRYPWEFSPDSQPDGRPSKAKAKEQIKKAYSGKTQRFRWTHSRLDGTPFEAEVTLSKLKIRDKSYLLAIVRDISEKVKAEKERMKTFIALKESEERFRSLVSSMEDIVITVNKEQRITGVYGRWMEKYNRDEGFFIGKRLDELVGRKASLPLVKGLKKALEGEYYVFDWAFEQDGTMSYYQVSVSPLREASGNINAVVGIARDVTLQKESEIQLKKALEEKTVLLQELHHRVKNSLQVIMSMLNLQKEHTTQKDALRIIDNMINRVYSMSMVHEMLYQSKDISQMNMADYIHTIATSLLRSLASDPDKIRLTFDLTPVQMNISKAIPCGLILNELLTNAFKYAFPGDEKGEINISLKRKKIKGKILVEMSVRDNGIGLPADFDQDQRRSLGFFLVKILGEDQLNGKLKIRRDKGTEVKLIFKED